MLLAGTLFFSFCQSINSTMEAEVSMLRDKVKDLKPIKEANEHPPKNLSRRIEGRIVRLEL